MLDPKTSLAIDAPPVVPYDDGFSTDSEDLGERERMLEDLASSILSISASSASKDAAVIENESIVHQQQIQVEQPKSGVKEKKSQHISPATSKSIASTTNGAVTGVKLPLNDCEKPGKGTSDKENGENCKNCNGHLTPLSERLKMMKTAAQQKLGKGPPLSRQCSCCYITYPFASLTYESRSRACTQPRCYKCNWAVKPSFNNGSAGTIGVKRTVDGEVKDSKEPCKPPTPNTAHSSHVTTNGIKTNGSTEATGDKDKKKNCCRNCKAQLPTLEERRGVMKYYTSMQIKGIPPPTRQCSCCFITYTLASISSKNTKHFCFACNDMRAEGVKAEEKAPHSSVAAVNKSTELKSAAKKNTPEIIVIDDAEDDEEGELLEEEICKCCQGKLIAMAERVKMMKEAAQKHGGKGPPPSRQCACCRVTYPSAALTNKSRQLTRTVPICRNCCQAGGNTIYEMLCVSDEFIEGFRIENPEMARNLLKKKENGKLDEAVKNQKLRMEMKKRATAARLDNQKKVAAARQRVSAATGKSMGSEAAVPVRQEPVRVGNEVAVNTAPRRPSRPRYHLIPMMARKSAPTSRLIIGRPANTTAVAPPARAHTVVQAVDHQREALPVSYLDPPMARTARWLRQFEIVDGKTARERRLEGRKKGKED